MTNLKELFIDSLRTIFAGLLIGIVLIFSCTFILLCLPFIWIGIFAEIVSFLCNFIYAVINDEDDKYN